MCNRGLVVAGIVTAWGVHGQRRARAARRAQVPAAGAARRLPCDARSRGPAAQLAPRHSGAALKHVAARWMNVARCARGATCPGLAGRAAPEGGRSPGTKQSAGTVCVRARLLGASNSPARPPERAFAAPARPSMPRFRRGGRHAVAAICGAPRSAAGRGALRQKDSWVESSWRPRSASIAGHPARSAGRGTMSRSRMPRAAGTAIALRGRVGDSSLICR